MDLVVVKFGGTSVGNGSRIKKAAQSVVNEYMKGSRVVVVVSAVNKTTDDLIGLSDEAIGASLTDKQKAEIMAMGELTSARVFSATIESLGLISKPVYFVLISFGVIVISLLEIVILPMLSKS